MAAGGEGVPSKVSWRHQRGKLHGRAGAAAVGAAGRMTRGPDGAPRCESGEG